jgi:hypothetical protein
MNNNDCDRGNRRYKFAWYAVTVVCVVAVVLLNSDRSIVIDNSVQLQQQQEEGSVGRLTPNQPKPIQWISVLGERNSGTRWLYE